jgi:hypothetical protein
VEGNNFNYEKTYHSDSARGGRICPQFLHHRGGKTSGADDDHHDNVHDEEGGNAIDDAGDDSPVIRLLGRQAI